MSSFDDLEQEDFVLAVRRVGRRQLNRLTLSPYQRGLLSRGMSSRVRDCATQEPALVRGMEYTAGVGAMLLDEIAFVYERTEEGLGRAVAGVERSVSDVDDRIDVVMRDITTGCIEGYSEPENYIKNAYKRTNIIQLFYLLNL